VYDYDRPGLDGRPRALDLDKARAALKPVSSVAGLRPRVPMEEGSGGRMIFSGSRFTVEHFESETSASVACDPTHFDLMVTLGGSGSIRAGREEMKYKRAEAFLVTADTGRVEVLPNEPSRWLRCYPVGRWQ
jgi:mannose-6-phosphate isomerase class I